MKENNVKSKSKILAIEIVTLYKYLSERRREFEMSKQLLKSGTSVGANIREAEHAESKADFIHKMAIAQKEINETLFWLELLEETKYLSKKEYSTTYPLAEEVMKLITSILKTTKASPRTPNTSNF